LLVASFNSTGFASARAVYQYALDYGAEMHLQAVVMHVSFDPGARLEFEELGNVHGPRDLAVPPPDAIR